MNHDKDDFLLIYLLFLALQRSNGNNKHNKYIMYKIQIYYK